MRSGNWRGLAVAIAVGAAMLSGSALDAKAGGLFHHTIPRETLALDYRTGDVMMAPPIPYGHYAKDYSGAVKGAAGMTFGAIHGLKGKLHGGLGKCGKCGGPSCGSCGGGGLFHGKSCGDCGGDGCGGCGLGLGGLLHHGDSACSDGKGGCLKGLLHHKGHGAGVSCVGAGCGTGYASAQAAPTPAPPAKAAGQTVYQGTPSGQSIDPVCGGCLGTGRLGHGGGCGLCSGTGRLRSLFGHGGGHGGKVGSPCGGCGGRGCGACSGGNGCQSCGGRGCGLCSGLKAKLHGLPSGLAAKLLHKGQIQYFVGPGGPVPITPGYVPYVVTTRSPRDFLAFPPYSDQIPRD